MSIQIDCKPIFKLSRFIECLYVSMLNWKKGKCRYSFNLENENTYEHDLKKPNTKQKQYELYAVISVLF